MVGAWLRPRRSPPLTLLISCWRVISWHRLLGGVLLVKVMNFLEGGEQDFNLLIGSGRRFWLCARWLPGASRVVTEGRGKADHELPLMHAMGPNVAGRRGGWLSGRRRHILPAPLWITEVEFLEKVTYFGFLLHRGKILHF